MCTLIQAPIDADMCPVTQFGDILMFDLDFVNFRILFLFQCSVSLSEILDHFLLADSLLKANNNAVISLIRLHNLGLLLMLQLFSYRLLQLDPISRHSAHDLDLLCIRQVKSHYVLWFLSKVSKEMQI